MSSEITTIMHRLYYFIAWEKERALCGLRLCGRCGRMHSITSWRKGGCETCHGITPLIVSSLCKWGISTGSVVWWRTNAVSSMCRLTTTKLCRLWYSKAGEGYDVNQLVPMTPYTHTLLKPLSWEGKHMHTYTHPYTNRHYHTQHQNIPTIRQNITVGRFLRNVARGPNPQTT